VRHAAPGRPAVVLLLVALAACAGRQPPTTPRAIHSKQVLVVLPPAPPPVWERYIIELAAEHRLYYYRAWQMESLGEVCIVYGLQPGESLRRTVARLAADPRVESAQEIQTFEVLADRAPSPPAPSPAVVHGGDPYAHLQQGAAAMRFDLAHRWATGRGVTVAVIDTGIDVGHPDLDGRVVRADNFVDRGTHSFTSDVHGTAVAGVLAAVEGNGIGIAGVAPEARIHSLKACWPLPEDGDRAVCDSYTLAQAVDRAVTAGARILNLSLSGPGDALLARLLGAAIARGVAVVAAADESRADLGFPASLAGVIAVRVAPRGEPTEAVAERAAAAGGDGALYAPGVDVLSTVPGGGYDFFSGSSMAAAHVSGLAALLLERQPRLTPAELAHRMAASENRAAAAMGGEGAAPGGVVDGGVVDGGAVGVVDACTAVSDLVGIRDGCPAADRLTR